MELHTPIFIRWRDSIGTPGWKEFEPSDLECLSIGFFIKKSKDRLVICQNVNEYNSGNYMEIPNESVTEIVELQPKQKKKR